jgi:hypothetical protein
LDRIYLEDGLWTGFQGLPQYQRKKAEDEVSYTWDLLIEKVITDYRAGRLVGGQSWEDAEPVLRTMARESRFSRRVLGKSFVEFLRRSAVGDVRARMECSPAGVTYVFLACPLGTDREYRRSELGCRCFIARGECPDNPIVVGIATEVSGKHEGCSLDLIRLDKPMWTSEDARKAEQIKAESGFFRSTTLTKEHEDEYPDS